MQGAIHALVGSASRQLSADGADDHMLPGPEYEACMEALEASLLEDLQQEQAAEAEAGDQFEADQLADLVAACTMSCQLDLGARASQAAASCTAVVPCPVCLCGQLGLAAQGQLYCTSPGCLEMVGHQFTPQEVQHRALHIHQQHQAGCDQAAAFVLTAARSNAVLACDECGFCDPLFSGNTQ